MKYTVPFFFIIGLSLFIACSNEPTSGEEQSQEESTAAPSQPGVFKPEKLPSMPGLMVSRLMDTLDNIDYQYHDLPISMSMSTESAIRQSLSHIANQRVRDSEGCEPAGRMWFVAEGDILIEGEFYLGPLCNFFVFSEDGEKKWANEMTTQGVTFFKLTRERAGF